MLIAISYLVSRALESFIDVLSEPGKPKSSGPWATDQYMDIYCALSIGAQSEYELYVLHHDSRRIYGPIFARLRYKTCRDDPRVPEMDHRGNMFFRPLAALCFRSHSRLLRDSLPFRLLTALPPFRVLPPSFVARFHRHNVGRD